MLLKIFHSYISDCEINSEFQWLNHCLVNKQGCTHRVIEKVWTSFHEMIIERRTTKCSGYAFIALKLMQELVKKNYRSQPSKIEIESLLSKRDQEILEYICGYILRRVKDIEGSSVLRSGSPTNSRLTESFDRGGLIYPSDNFVIFIESAESVFRTIPHTSVSKELFTSKCDEENLFSRLHDCFANDAASYTSIEKLYVKILHLFFIIRAHQKCRNLLQKELRSSKINRKSKALRDSL